MRNTVSLSAAAIMTAAGAWSASADVGYNNLGMNDTYGTGVYNINGPGSGIQWTQGFRFTPQRSGTITRLVVPVESFASNTFLSFRVATDNSGFPGTDIGTIGDIGPAMINPPPYPPPSQINATSSISISAGVPYWLICSASGSGEGGWFYNSTGQSGLRASRLAGDLNWNIDSTTTAAFRIEITPTCPADFDGNGHVEPADVSLFVNTWFNSLASGTLAGDFDHNGIVQPADVSLFISTWLAALAAGGC